MNEELGRDLTMLEYIVLGLVSVEPRTGYDIIGALENDAYRRSTSPGSIYPALKRLEKQGLIAGEVESVHETRPRKVYRITGQGETLLDKWLRSPLTMTEALEERDVVLVRFLFSEKRLSREEILGWLEAYEKNLESYDAPRRMFYDIMHNVSSIHQQLIIEAKVMELNTQREWIKLARERLKNAPTVTPPPGPSYIVYR